MKHTTTINTSCDIAIVDANKDNENQDRKRNRQDEFEFW